MNSIKKRSRRRRKEYCEVQRRLISLSSFIIANSPLIFIQPFASKWNSWLNFLVLGLEIFFEPWFHSIDDKERFPKGPRKLFLFVLVLVVGERKKARRGLEWKKELSWDLKSSWRGRKQWNLLWTLFTHYAVLWKKGFLVILETQIWFIVLRS